MKPFPFAETFKALTGNLPFPWQASLSERLERGDIPASCNLPTGLGKTSVIAVWLIALANGAKVPRRLVYVVNRRTVVDQTTEEVEKYRAPLAHRRAPVHPLLLDLADALAALSSDTTACPLALSTLRGQFADNREWSADPSRPAVICGTVDMIGSRLLFSGYGIGMKARQLHAGFLGQDALLVHDEAHLEPAFQTLIESVQAEQAREPAVPWPKFRVMELTATSRGEGEVFPNEEEKYNNDADLEVRKRVYAKKAIHLHEQEDKAKLAEQLAKLALKSEFKGRAILVFARTVDDVLKIRDKLPRGQVETLTGTMRGLERDGLIENKTFARFLPKPPADATQGTVYLVCTSAGEVGVNISADHLICDLSTFESMAQRFGRVNRFGEFDPCEIHVVYPVGGMWDDKHPLTEPRQKTLALLQQLTGDGSPTALGALPLDQRIEAFAPPPTILPATDILFDAWALTSITDKLPGRPKVEPYLHGLPTDWQPPETQVAWREEISVFDAKPWIDQDHKERDTFATELLELFPLKPPEVLKDVTARVFDRLKKMKLAAETPVWLQDEDGAVSVTKFGDIIAGDKEDLNYLTVILPRTAGGLNSQGMLDEKATDPVPDASEEVFADREKKHPRRIRLWSTQDGWEKKAEDYRLLRRISFPAPEGDEDAVGKEWLWFTLDNEGDTTAKGRVEWCVHVADVERHAAAIVDNLPIGDTLREVVKLAAKYHDHGKRRKLFQRILGNADPNIVLAKSGKKGGRVKEKYRHEFGSLVDVELKKLLDSVELQDPDWKELVLHLIAAHHGRGRPHFPADEAFDPDGHTAECERIAREVPRRFARLQRRYGRWGLAYLESLLRAADWAASGNPSEYLTKEEPK